MKPGAIYDIVLTQSMDLDDVRKYNGTTRKFKKGSCGLDMLMKYAFRVLWVTVVLLGAKPSIEQREIPPELRVFVQALYSNDPRERVSASLRLGQMGVAAADAIPYLIDSLGDESAVAFCSLQLPQSFPNYTTPFAEAKKALSRIGEPAVAPLIQALKDKRKGVQTGAAGALGLIKDKRAVKPLIEAMEHEKSDPSRSYMASAFRRAIVCALGNIGDKRATGCLIEALKDTSSGWSGNIRAEAALALGKLRAIRALLPLMRARHDKDDDVRRYASWAIDDILRRLWAFVIPLIVVTVVLGYSARKHLYRLWKTLHLSRGDRNNMRWNNAVAETMKTALGNDLPAGKHTVDTHYGTQTVNTSIQPKSKVKDILIVIFAILLTFLLGFIILHISG